MFKKNDTVRCLRNIGYRDRLTVGKTYTLVSDQRGAYVSMVGDTGVGLSAFANRFELVKEAPKAAFKVGDRVRAVTKVFLAEMGANATVGPKGVFTDLYGHTYVDITWDGPKSNGMMDGGYLSDSFELLPTAPSTASKTWIISLLEGAVLKPATNPKTYTSEEQAHRVAKAMAEKHKGSTFVVFEATGFIHVPVTPVVEVVKL